MPVFCYAIAMNASLKSRAGVVVAVVGWLLAAVVAVNATTYLPPFALGTQSGATFESTQLMDEAVLVFLLPNCSGCDEVLAQIADLMPSYPSLVFAAVTAMESASLADAIASYGIDLPLLIDADSLLASLCIAFEAPLVCTFSSGKLVSRLSWSFTEEELAEELDVLANGVSVPWPTGIDLLYGRTLPVVEATSVTGTPVSIGSFDGSGLIVFLGGECPYCESMVPALMDAADEISLQVVVSGAVVEDSLSLALAETSAQLVFDFDWEIADQYRIQGVPTFMLADETGTAVWIHAGLIDGLPSIAKAAAQ